MDQVSLRASSRCACSQGPRARSVRTRPKTRARRSSRRAARAAQGRARRRGEGARSGDRAQPASRRSLRAALGGVRRAQAVQGRHRAHAHARRRSRRPTPRCSPRSARSSCSSGDRDDGRAAAPAGRREGTGALRRAAAARPLLARHRQVARFDRRVRGVLRESPGQRSRSEDARHRVELADAYLRFRQPQKALALFDAAANASAQERICARASASRGRPRRSTARRRAALLHDLEPIAEQHPEVWLVDGQCALALGDAGGALALGRRYLEHGAEGHGGRARARRRSAGGARQPRRGAQGARDSRARSSRQRRRWTVRLAFVLRRASKLARMRSPRSRSSARRRRAGDRSGLVGRARRVAARAERRAKARRAARAGRCPSSPSHAADPRRARRGAARGRTRPRPRSRRSTRPRPSRATPRCKKLLADALDDRRGAASSSANDAAAAEPLLARADRSTATPLVWRNLGIALLALEQARRCGRRARPRSKADASPIVADARRARARRSPATSPARARSTSARSPRDKDNARGRARLGGLRARPAAIRRSRSPRSRRPRAAAADRPARRTSQGRARRRAPRRRPRAAPRRQRREGRRAPARGRVPARPRSHAVRSRGRRGRRGRLRGRAHRAQGGQGQSCPFPPPADTQAAPILIAFTEGLNREARRQGARRLTALGGKSTGPGRAAARHVDPRRRARGRAGRLSRTASSRRRASTSRPRRAANAQVGADEVAHNLAVLDLADGKVDAAIAQLEKPRAEACPRRSSTSASRTSARATTRRRSTRGAAHARPACGSPRCTNGSKSKERIYGEGEP